MSRGINGFKKCAKNRLVKFANILFNAIFCLTNVKIHEKVVINTFPDLEDQGFVAAMEFVKRQIPVFIFFDRRRIRKMASILPIGITAVPRNSATAVFLSKTAKWVFFSHGFALATVPRKGQITVNLWHGTPIKRVGFLDQRKIQLSDFILVDPNFQQAYEGMFPPGTTRPIPLPFGLPRNDLLRPAQLGEHLTRKVIWLPTFRQSVRGEQRVDGFSGDFGYGVNLEDIYLLDQAMNRLGVFIDVKFHPMSNSSLPKDLTNICEFFSSFDDSRFYSKLNEYDALISDYSSVILDFAYTRKPILIFSPDFDEYSDGRGFTHDIKNSIQAEFSRSVKTLVLDIEDIYKEPRRQKTLNQSIKVLPSALLIADYFLKMQN